MDPKESLKNLGLAEKEISIYLSLLELGEASVLEISKRSNVKRPTTYVVLQSLGEKGLISKVIKGKKTLFLPQHPRKLITEAELHLKELQETVPHLEHIFKKKEGKPQVLIYEGRDELDRAYDESFLIKGEVVYMGTLKLSQEVFPKTFRKAGYAPLSTSFQIRELIDDSEESRVYAQKVANPFRQVRLMPKRFLPFEADIGIFGNRVLITSVKKEYFTVVIESKEIANAFRTLFGVMWQTASPL